MKSAPNSPNFLEARRESGVFPAGTRPTGSLKNIACLLSAAFGRTQRLFKGPPAGVRFPVAVHATGWVALSGALALPLAPAAAGDLRANASLNPVGTNSSASPGAFTSAYWPDPLVPKAGATATRTQLTAFSDGTGVEPPWVYGAGANLRSDYTLWDPSTNASVGFAVASTLTLSFNFRATGSLIVDPVSLSTGSASFNAAIFSQIADTESASVNVVFGPVPPFPSEGYIVLGDAGMLGAYDRRFSLLHQYREAGVLTMDFGNTASNAARAGGSLTLESIVLVGGEMPAGGLAVHMLDSGEKLVVYPVPEPAAGALFLIGAVALTGVARRRSRPQEL
jgi:hypothetical protein